MDTDSQSIARATGTFGLDLAFKGLAGVAFFIALRGFCGLFPHMETTEGLRLWLDHIMALFTAITMVWLAVGLFQARVGTHTGWRTPLSVGAGFAILGAVAQGVGLVRRVGAGVTGGDGPWTLAGHVALAVALLAVGAALGRRGTERQDAWLSRWALAGRLCVAAAVVWLAAVWAAGLLPDADPASTVAFWLTTAGTAACGVVLIAIHRAIGAHRTAGTPRRAWGQGPDQADVSLDASYARIRSDLALAERAAAAAGGVVSGADDDADTDEPWVPRAERLRRLQADGQAPAVLARREDWLAARYGLILVMKGLFGRLGLAIIAVIAAPITTHDSAWSVLATLALMLAIAGTAGVHVAGLARLTRVPTASRWTRGALAAAGVLLLADVAVLVLVVVGLFTPISFELWTGLQAGTYGLALLGPIVLCVALGLVAARVGRAGLIRRAGLVMVLLAVLAAAFGMIVGLRGAYESELRQLGLALAVFVMMLAVTTIALLMRLVWETAEGIDHFVADAEPQI